MIRRRNGNIGPGGHVDIDSSSSGAPESLSCTDVISREERDWSAGGVLLHAVPTTSIDVST